MTLADLINATQPTAAADDRVLDVQRPADATPPIAEPMSAGRAAAGKGLGSWLSPCECPGDCLRDHELD
jgi:hypothetical protein